MDEELEQNETQQSLGEIAEGAKKVADKAKKKADKAKKKLAKKATKQAGKGMAKLAANPLFWKIAIIVAIVLLVIILVAALIAVIVYVVTASDYDAENGLLSSMFGISGDKFYGARFVYEDDAVANLEIEDDYYNFTYSILQDTSSQTGLTITLSADYRNDENVSQIVSNFANDLINNTNAPLATAQCILSIDHFGFSSEEIVVVIQSIAETLTENSWASASQSTIQTALSQAYELPKYQTYSAVCPKLYVWDYILESEDDILEWLPKKDYCGMIYMPKEEVTITYTSFMFVVDGGYGVDVCLKQKTEGSDAIALGNTVNANASWYYDNHMQEYYECEFNVTLNTFEAINTADLTALSTATSIYSLIKNGTYSIYFDAVDEYSGQNLVNSVNDANYMFLSLENKDQYSSPFNVAEHIVEYN